MYLFLERGTGGRKRGKHQCVVASCTPPTRAQPLGPSQACALTGNQTHNPLVCRLVLSPLSYTSQDSKFFIKSSLCPDWVSQLVGVLSQMPKGCGFNPWSGHKYWRQPVTVSLFVFLSPCISNINKHTLW